MPLSIFTFISVQDGAGGYTEYSWDFIHSEVSRLHGVASGNP
jgi:hypothetical protein